MSGTYLSVSVNDYYLAPVSTASLLPASAAEGAVIVVLDETAIYVWDGAAWTKVAEPIP